MNLHNEIMNINCAVGHAYAANQTAYKMGHRDARHAAAELALRADAEIERLQSSLVIANHMLEELGGSRQP
jgi:hypothetical protein